MYVILYAVDLAILPHEIAGYLSGYLMIELLLREASNAHCD